MEPLKPGQRLRRMIERSMRRPCDIRGAKVPLERPFFSLCHSTARAPDGWVRAFETWYERADNPREAEYILTYDAGRSLFEPAVEQHFYSRAWHSVRVQINNGRRCAVDGWNAAGAASNGRFLITVADDWFPPEHWDTEIIEVLSKLPHLGNGEYVLDVDSGGEPGCLYFSLLTREYYKKLGSFFYPEYLGMFADNDFTEQAKQDGVIVNARHLKFPHEHPAYGTAKTDATYAHQHRTEAWETGKRVFKKRWPGVMRDSVMLCLPGENFSAQWLAYSFRLYGHLLKTYNVAPLFEFSTNLYETRASMLAKILDHGMNTPADWVLMLDDDNVLSPPQFETLLDDLKQNPELDGVAGWYWNTIDFYDLDDTKTSVGQIVKSEGSIQSDRIIKWSYEDLAAGDNPLKRIEFSGLGCFLFRYTALLKAGAEAFTPLENEHARFGFAGDDGSFFIRANLRGMKFAVDRRIKVPHLKLRSPEPRGYRHMFPVVL